MATTARHDLTVWRNDEVWDFRLRVRGPSLVNQVARVQLRRYADAPGAALVELLANPMVISAAALPDEGIRLLSSVLVDGAYDNDLLIRINKAHRQALPYAGVAGDPFVGEWAVQLDGRTRMQGVFAVPAHAIESEGAPGNRAVGDGLSAGGGGGGAILTIAADDSVTLSIEGVDLIAPLVATATAAAATATTKAAEADADAVVAQQARTAVQPILDDLAGPDTIGTVAADLNGPDTIGAAPAAAATATTKAEEATAAAQSAAQSLAAYQNLQQQFFPTQASVNALLAAIQNLAGIVSKKQSFNYGNGAAFTLTESGTITAITAVVIDGLEYEVTPDNFTLNLPGKTVTPTTALNALIFGAQRITIKYLTQGS